jgi:hypothetical protein
VRRRGKEGVWVQMARRRDPERTGEGERGSEQGLRDADDEEEGGEGWEGWEGCQEGVHCVKKGVREGSEAQSAQEREGGGLGADGVEVGKVGCRRWREGGVGWVL